MTGIFDAAKYPNIAHNPEPTEGSIDYTSFVYIIHAASSLKYFL